MVNPDRTRALVVVLVLVGLIAPQAASAADPQFDAQVRVRENVLLNHDFDSDVDDPDNHARMRARVGMTFEAGEYTTAYVQIQDTRSLGEPATTTTSLEQTDLHQGYILVRNTFNSDLDFQVGRHEMAYGGQRQIGNRDWLDTGRSFDGARLMFDIENFGWFHVLAHKLNETGGPSTIQAGAGVTEDPVGEQALLGAYLHYDANEQATIEVYVLDVYQDAGDLTNPDPTADDTEDALGNLFTAGGRVTWAASDRDLELYGEGAMQFGSAPETVYGEDGVDYAGYAATAGFRYGLQTAVRSWLGFEFNFASGDDGSDATENGTYQQLFPSSHPVLGFMDFVGWQNVLAFQGTLGVEPGDGWKIWASYHDFSVNEAADSVYDADGIAWLSGNADFDTALGREIDVAARFSPEESLSFLAKFGLWLPGDYQEQAVGGVDTPADLDPAMSIFVQTTATF